MLNPASFDKTLAPATSFGSFFFDKWFSLGLACFCKKTFSKITLFWFLDWKARCKMHVQTTFIFLVSLFSFSPHFSSLSRSFSFPSFLLIRSAFPSLCPPSLSSLSLRPPPLVLHCTPASNFDHPKLALSAKCCTLPHACQILH